MLVSAIMPTRGRQKLASECLLCFYWQSYANRELVVIDDEDDPSFPCGIHDNQVRYVRLPHRFPIGTKRNIAAAFARGETIVHFDSDDFYHPHRIEDQARRLEKTGKAVTGYRNICFTDGENWWKNANWPGGYGASLCYRRDWWTDHLFPESSDGEDWHFVKTAMQQNEFVVADAGVMMHATIHADNTSPRVIGEGWVPING